MAAMAHHSQVLGSGNAMSTTFLRRVMRFRGALWAISFVTMLAGSPVLSQTVRVTLTGSVTDAQGRTLQGAQVTVDPGDERAVSDAQGLFTFPALPNGEDTITIKYEGFTAWTPT